MVGAIRPYRFQVDGKRGGHLLDGLITSVSILLQRGQQDCSELGIDLRLCFDSSGCPDVPGLSVARKECTEPARADV